ncbi:hypothetical protein [Legionella cardiaca]|uniref:Uncharacterized protein n=1 Tax=Legionella cardiaca TaxID=1071983 RepID=A0ABY8AMI9_9GAMM|nr:hypothetical protein [Legionella cardiaca]WED41870.1 hypothetical protein PXX05_07960 [Legionella cardiaca]
MWLRFDGPRLESRTSCKWTINFKNKENPVYYIVDLSFHYCEWLPEIQRAACHLSITLRNNIEIDSLLKNLESFLDNDKFSLKKGLKSSRRGVFFTASSSANLLDFPDLNHEECLRVFKEIGTIKNVGVDPSIPKGINDLFGSIKQAAKLMHDKEPLLKGNYNRINELAALLTKPIEDAICKDSSSNQINTPM